MNKWHFADALHDVALSPLGGAYLAGAAGRFAAALLRAGARSEPAAGGSS